MPLQSTPAVLLGGVLRSPASAAGDVRDALRAACAAQPQWAAQPALRRGEAIYRLAEMVEARAGGSAGIEAAVDACVYWAGFADKLGALLGAVPAAGPALALSRPVPRGVAGVICPDDGGVGHTLRLVCPAVAAGNCVVAVVPASAAVLGEVVVASGLPAGVVNLLTGDAAALRAALCADAGLDVVDLTGAPPAERTDLETRAAANLTPVVATGGAETLATIAAFCTLRTAWHPARL